MAIKISSAVGWVVLPSRYSSTAILWGVSRKPFALYSSIILFTAPPDWNCFNLGMIIIILFGLVKSFFTVNFIPPSLFLARSRKNGTNQKQNNLIFIIYEKTALCDTESEKEAH